MCSPAYCSQGNAIFPPQIHQTWPKPFSPALYSMSEFVKPTATMVDGEAQKKCREIMTYSHVTHCQNLGWCFLPPHRNWPTPTVDFQSEQISGWHDDRKKLKFRVRLKICKCRLLRGSSIYDINSGDGCRKTKAKLREVA